MILSRSTFTLRIGSSMRTGVRRRRTSSKMRRTCMTMITRSRSRQKSFHTLTLRLRIRLRLNRNCICDQKMMIMTVMKGFQGCKVNTIRSLLKILSQTVSVKNQIECNYTKLATSLTRANAQDKEAVATHPIAIKEWQQTRSNSRRKESLLRKIALRRMMSGLQAVINSNR